MVKKQDTVFERVCRSKIFLIKLLKEIIKNELYMPIF